jgi:site-specific DNA-methyltransferase (adenine-specific)
MDGKNTVLFSKKSDDWETPQWLFDLLDQEFHFCTDAAATYGNCKKNRFFIDALNIRWEGVPGPFWLNPPYSQIAAFLKKVYEESQKGAVVVCLIPVRSDTHYWHDYVMKAQEIRFVKGRLKFGDATTGAPFPSCVVIFDKSMQYSLGIPIIPPMIGKTIEQIRKDKT